jgi:transcriptional regulator with XRE-family HTH domain
MGTHAVQRDATAQTVSVNVKRLRTRKNLGLRALARKLEEVGRPLRHSAIDQIEKGTRRVDVDDLVALALALDTSPMGLLLPHGDDPAELVPVGGNDKVPAERFWRWLRGEVSVTAISDMGLAANTLPPWKQFHNLQWRVVQEEVGSDGIN